MGKLLGVFAHPDDESISSGGTISKYAKAGWHVDLVTATHGEAGGSALVRGKELEEAAQRLGIRTVTFLDYNDGKLADNTAGEIEDKLATVMEELQPDVIITHEPAGITNHPDHIKLSLATTFAFQKYAWDKKEPPKLYYACVPETVMAYLIKNKYFPAELHGKPVMGVEDKRISTVINIKKFASTKRKSLESHMSQRELLSKYLENSQFFTQEFFILRMVGRIEAFMGKNDRVSDRL